MIDIIVPVYNTPIEDLERCFNSILNQSFKDYKVFIIDDGSKDKIRIYLDDVSKDKDNFIVKHISNGGVSNARNIGIEISDSEYITFVDSDDTLEDNFLLESYNLINDYNLDIVIGGYNEIKNNKIIKTRASLPGLHIYDDYNKNRFLEKLLSGKTNDNNIEIGDCPTGRIYNRLFKRECIGNLRFNDNIKISEDTLFMVDYTYKAHRIGVVDKVWYNYYINDYSISNSTNKDKMIIYINEFINEIKIRMNNEVDDNIKKAYMARIDKANKYIYELKKH